MAVVLGSWMRMVTEVKRYEEPAISLGDEDEVVEAQYLRVVLSAA